MSILNIDDLYEIATHLSCSDLITLLQICKNIFNNPLFKQLLITKKVDQLIINNSGDLNHSLLTFCQYNTDKVIIVDELIRRGAVPTTDCALMASSYGNVNILNHLLKDSRCNPFEDDHILVYPCLHGNLNIVNILLQDNRADPSVYGNAAIIVAIQNGNYEIVDKLLKDPRFKAGKEIEEAVRFAKDTGRDKILRRLMKHYQVRKGLKEYEIWFKQHNKNIKRFNFTRYSLNIINKS